MSEVLFYHLELSTAENVLPGLLERTLGRGWRALVRLADAEATAGMDAHLWAYSDESFLPHGTDDAVSQPVFLMDEGEAPTGFDCLFLVAGADAPVETFAAYSRVVVMFSEADAPAARTRWKAVKDAGLEATYWRQSPSGKWEKAA